MLRTLVLPLLVPHRDEASGGRSRELSHEAGDGGVDTVPGAIGSRSGVVGLAITQGGQKGLHVNVWA